MRDSSTYDSNAKHCLRVQVGRSAPILLKYTDDDSPQLNSHRGGELIKGSRIVLRGLLTECCLHVGKLGFDSLSFRGFTPHSGPVDSSLRARSGTDDLLLISQVSKIKCMRSTTNLKHHFGRVLINTKRSKYLVRVLEFSPISPKYTVFPPLARKSNRSNSWNRMAEG
jgi:hypothetical protein